MNIKKTSMVLAAGNLLGFLFVYFTPSAIKNPFAVIFFLSLIFIVPLALLEAFLIKKATFLILTKLAKNNFASTIFIIAGFPLCFAIGFITDLCIERLLSGVPIF